MGHTLSAVEELLAAWNPLEVPRGIALSEYSIYAPVLCRMAKENADVVVGLVEILEGMGIEETDLNSGHMQELRNLAISIESAVTRSNG